jgi:putative tryptophan/tyrosine transport system substrate-binding protein
MGIFLYKLIDANWWWLKSWVRSMPSMRGALLRRGVATTMIGAILIPFILALSVQAQTVSTTDNIMVVVSESTDAYQQVAERMRIRFELTAPERAKFTVQTLQEVTAKGQDTFSGSQLVVTVGVQAAQLVNGYGLRVPVLHTLIPKASYEKILQGKVPAIAQNISALYIDQPHARQLELVHCVMPQASHVGVLLGADGSATAKSLEQAAKTLGLQMETESVLNPEQLPSSLKRVLARSEALLALPDAQVYNQSTLPTILLNAYRSNAPVFGFSAGQVKAGALAAVYSTPEQIGNHAGEWLLRAGAGGKWTLSAPQYPRYFSVAVNREVSRSLDIQVDEDIVLQEKLKRSARGDS